MIDIAALEIERIIFHEIKKQKLGSHKEPPIFSDIESELDNKSKEIIKSRIILTINSPKAHEIIFSAESESPVPDYVRTLLNKPEKNLSNEDFVTLSKAIAQHLNTIQTGVNPGGFVTIIIGKNKNFHFAALLKIERDEGVRLEETERDGKKTFKINNIHDLILTKNTKFFKISLFLSENIGTGKYLGMICDNQLAGKKDYANFFLDDFLGCNLTDDPSMKTQDFFKVATKFIQKFVKDPVVQSKYRLHLLSSLSNEGKTIQPRKFAASSLQLEHRDQFESFLIKEGVGVNDIVRDTSLIDKDIKEMILEFENGVRIIGNQENFEENVKTEQLKTGETKAVVISKLK